MENEGKRKRGRPRKSKAPVEPAMAPSLPTALIPTDHTHRILKGLMESSKIGPFLEKPDARCFGLHNYYTIVTRPMWLREICRKAGEGLYDGPGGLARDVRLMVSNCRRYWGSCHRFSRAGACLLAALSRLLSSLPPDEQLKVQEECAGDDLGDDAEIEGGGLEQQDPNGGGSDSGDWWEGGIVGRGTAVGVRIPTGVDVNSMTSWESVALPPPTLPLGALWQLVTVGQFLKVAHGALDLDEITQYEVERMLLMPRRSFTLACLMTSMLCPRFLRTHLFSSPVMCYDVWNHLLKNKLELWYKIYYTQHNVYKVVEKSGVELDFWAAMGDVNPMTEKDYEELTLFQRAWILHALCTYVLHSIKSVEESLLLSEGDLLRPIHLTSDAKYDYFSLFAPEIRVYRYQKYFPSAVSKQKKAHRVHPLMDYFLESFEKTGYMPPRAVLPDEESFCLVAWDEGSLAALAAVVPGLATSVHALDFSQHGAYTLAGQASLYAQYHDDVEKEPGFVAKSKDYWIGKNRGPMPGCPLSPERRPAALFANDQLDLLLALGKRERKKRFLEDSIVDALTADEGSDVSDWETEHIRRSKRLRRARPRQSASTQPNPARPQSPIDHQGSSDLCDVSWLVRRRVGGLARPVTPSSDASTESCRSPSPPPVQPPPPPSLHDDDDDDTPILTRGRRPDGTLGFLLVLPDKRILPLSDQAAHNLTLLR